MMLRFLRRLRYWLLVPRQQTCEDCWRTDGIDFHVDTWIWNLVAAPPEWLAEMAECVAQARGIDYSGSVAVMGRHAWLASGEAAERVRRERVTAP
jgi:hypothetical protein